MADDASPAGRPMVGRIQSEDEHGDLLTYHLAVLRAAETAVETAKGPVTEAKAVLAEKQEALTKAFNSAKGDLGRHYSREYLGGLMKDARGKTTEQVEREKIRFRDKLILNQPVYGGQPELFTGEETPLEARDEMAWTAEGLLRGMRGDLEEIQDKDPPRFHQAIMLGFEAGQKLTQERTLRAMQLIKARQQPDVGAEVVDLNAPEPGTIEAEEADAAAVKRAKESLDAMGPAPGQEPGPDEVAAEPVAAPKRRAKADAGTGEPEPAAVH